MKLGVFLQGSLVGSISLEPPIAKFTFGDDYLTSSSRQVLGLPFEESLGAAWRGVNRLPPWFSNLLPEGQLRQLLGTGLRLPASNATNVATEAALISAVGQDLPGAVTIAPMEQAEELRTRPLAADLTVPEAQSDPNLFKFSVAGVGVKFSMSRAGEQFVGPAAGLGDRWLLKLPDKSFPHLPFNEFAMMSLARAVGIEVPRIEIVHRDQVLGIPDFVWVGEEFAFAIQRFDRLVSGKVHMEDLAQVRSLYPEDKYLGNYETVAALVYRQEDEDSLTEFVRRLAFVVAIGNDDAHLKNWTLIYPDGRRPRLSPAYDMVSGALYPGSGLTRGLALKLGGSRRYDALSIEHFDRLVRKIGAPIDGREIAFETIRAVREHLAVAEAVLATRLDADLLRAELNSNAGALGV